MLLEDLQVVRHVEREQVQQVQVGLEEETRLHRVHVVVQDVLHEEVAQDHHELNEVDHQQDNSSPRPQEVVTPGYHHFVPLVQVALREAAHV